MESPNVTTGSGEGLKLRATEEHSTPALLPAALPSAPRGALGTTLSLRARRPRIGGAGVTCSLSAFSLVVASIRYLWAERRGRRCPALLRERPLRAWRRGLPCGEGGGEGRRGWGWWGGAGRTGVREVVGAAGGAEASSCFPSDRGAPGAAAGAERKRRWRGSGSSVGTVREPFPSWALTLVLLRGFSVTTLVCVLG